ncbi:kynureninase [Sphingomonas sp. SUN039]|uniref:kynureninase n=1 Tax=Sphingomonas sp. SUN039 TaxID=2937787 RepID=UPI002164B0AA|nr:kynureninase [Sphingomonas sp. SUN039]UVO54668.1 kynureninase [Sphingomonas sp. SUN039]
MSDLSLAAAQARDAADPFAFARDRFTLPDGVIYLDGNSLGALPLATSAAMADVIAGQWGEGLVTSWNRHDWIGLPQRLGARIAPLIGAAPDEVIVTDTTSTNLFKLIAAALAARPHRQVILSEAGNFPTDLYIAQGAAAMRGAQLKTAAGAEILSSLDDHVAVLLLTHVHYKTGSVHDMAAITAAAHAVGALVIWDLSHSTGAVPVDLNGCNADLAVGCGYKYLNGGPGAPAFLYVARRLQNELHSPLSGWMGHAAPFAFEDGYRPAPGIDRFLSGTPSVLAMAALDAGLDTFDGVDTTALFAKGRALGDYCIALMDARCAGQGFALISPRNGDARGSHVSFAHLNAWPICQALIARGVIGDFRAPDALRLGFAPLYTGFADVWHAVEAIRDIVDSGAWDAPAYHAHSVVT